MKAVALFVCTALLAGCFGYNSSAKKWAYVGDSVLMLGGGGVVAADQTSSSEPCTTGADACPYHSPIGGATIAGVVLITAGVVGLLYNLTRPTQKTSR